MNPTLSLNRALSLIESAREELIRLHLVKSAYDLKQITEFIKMEMEERKDKV